LGQIGQGLPGYSILYGIVTGLPNALQLKA
jgi:hypothetical protein